MKNFFLSVILIAILSAILQLVLPWWTIAIAAFVIGFFVKQNTWSAFASGFVAVFLLWIVYAYALSSANEHILAKKVAELLPLEGYVTALFLVTGIIGGLVSGFAALSGNFAGKMRE